MRFASLNRDERTVIVLGAGASRGASFAPDLPGVKPPLDSDFFTQAQKLSHKKPPELVEELIENTVQIFGNNFRLTMEGFLTQVEHLSNVFEDYKLQGRPVGNPYPDVRQQFLQVLAAVLDEALGREPRCTHHTALVNSLAASDTILSFNYDWLIDTTLRDYGPNKWNPRTGYGVNAYINGPEGAGTRYWASVSPQSGRKIYPVATVKLLKMHGSINWFPVRADLSRLRLQLRQRWWHQQGSLQFEIAPPEWNKPIRSGVYREIWRQARAKLRSARALVFVGYSLPNTDLPAQALFMVDAMKGQPRKAHNLELLVLVNPDRTTRARIRHVLSERIDTATRIVTFDYFENFADFLNAS